MDKDKILAVGHPLDKNDLKQYHSLKKRIVAAFGKKDFEDLNDFEEKVADIVYQHLLENLCADIKKSAGIKESLIPEENGHIEKCVNIIGAEYRPHYEAKHFKELYGKLKAEKI